MQGRVIGICRLTPRQDRGDCADLMFMETLGQHLRREREFRKIALKEVSQATRIQMDVLQALEGDQFQKFPTTIFVKGFLKSYCKFVGLNTDDILLLYEETMRSRPGVAVASRKAGLGSRSWKKAMKVILLLAVLAALAAVLSTL